MTRLSSPKASGGAFASGLVLRLLVATASVCAGSVHAGAVPKSGIDVGNGFRVAEVSLPTGPKAWESLAHYRILYYRDTKLGQYDSFSVAPSGKYALFQDAPTEKVVLFTCATGNRRVVAKRPKSFVEKYVWRETQREATVLFRNGSSVRISLSAR